ncbi:g-patch domain-containing protein [Phthorimaea operculella]|nr:g-patch domain-containing protein [Phthorimaea operculella]
MGWSAGGLGAAGQGIAEPISGGAVRDKQDQYKGIHCTDTLHSYIDSISNKGHQLLQKMGWSAGGLGAAGQGIAEPISDGAVRDKQDQYKGIHCTDTLHSYIDSISNKGHQLLQKMGWSAGGLGAAGQGIAEPISDGAVRDKQDQYKGIGVNLNDPYENFRKNKGAAFITRMKERALERSS